MNRSVRHLQARFTIQAADGPMNGVSDLLFDDEQWTIRYIVVAHGGPLSGGERLLSPAALGSVDWKARRLEVRLTAREIADSPPVDSRLPISRQKEIEYSRYLALPVYWHGFGLWGNGMVPEFLRGQADPGEAAEGEKGPAGKRGAGDSHLRSVREVLGYRIEAPDGEVGHVEDFVVDDHSWRITNMVVDTWRWLPGRKVIVDPQWIDRVDWSDAAVYVRLPREAVRSATEI